MKTFRFNEYIFEYEDDFNFTPELLLNLVEKRDRTNVKNTAEICKAVVDSINSIGDNIAKSHSWKCYNDPVSGVEHIDFYENQDQVTKK